ncbi:hypothetical protein GCM10009681_04460 [Luedemannella helvata]|uniref:Uncharacterized protein n=2 Tax=Luedemannella helvata TaxID=349315 RepID=A0ABN2JRW3_9ACTN
MPEAGETAGYVGRRRGRSGVGMSFVDGIAVIGGAARLWWRHWPALIAVYLAGAAASAWLIRLAVVVSRTSGTAGLLVFFLAPLATMTSLAVMLLLVRPSLPRLRDGGRGSAGDLVRHLAALLVPFLAIYASLGMLRDDGSAYSYALFEDEVLKSSAPPDAWDMSDRFPFTTRLAIVVAILIVVFLRWGLPRWDRLRSWVLFGLVMGYVELLWMSQLARYVSPENEWLRERQMFAWLEAGWERLAGASGPAGGLVTWVGEQLGRADVVLVAPLSLLLLGAVVYRREIQLSLEVDEDKPPPVWLGELPGPMRWLGTGIYADLRNRFGALVNGVRIMSRVGFVPTLFFCLLFTAALAVGNVAWELERLIIGPQDLASRWTPLSLPLSALNEAAGMVTVTCVLAASIDRILLVGRRGVGAEPAGPAPVASAPVPQVVQSGAVSHA